MRRMTNNIFDDNFNQMASITLIQSAEVDLELNKRFHNIEIDLIEYVNVNDVRHTIHIEPSLKNPDLLRFITRHIIAKKFTNKNSAIIACKRLIRRFNEDHSSCRRSRIQYFK